MIRSQQIPFKYRQPHSAGWLQSVRLVLEMFGVVGEANSSAGTRAGRCNLFLGNQSVPPLWDFDSQA